MAHTLLKEIAALQLENCLFTLKEEVGELSIPSPASMTT